MDITAIDPHYDVGMATMSTSSRTMTGSGTQWLANVVPGDQVYGADGRMGGVVETVNTNTSITLVKNWRGGNQSAGVYTIQRISDSARVERFSQRLLNLLLGNNIAAFGDLALAANKGIHATGAGAVATHDLTPFARTLLDDANATAARGTLELVKQTTLSDTTAGRLLSVGSFGVGDGAYILDLNAAPPGFFLASSSTANAPPGDGLFHGCTYRSSETSSQFQVAYSVNRGVSYLRRFVGGVWGPWGNEVAYGSNANGSWSRTPDGTQRCWGIFNHVCDADVDTIFTRTMPAAFVGNFVCELVLMAPMSTNNYEVRKLQSSGNLSTLSARVRVTSTQEYVMGYKAEGRFL